MSKKGVEPVDWKTAAITLGEYLGGCGPDNYYSMTAAEWLQWAKPIAIAFTEEKGLEPVAWMFVTRDRKSKRRDEFAAIDWSPSPDDDRELISKRPLVYAHPPTQVEKGLEPVPNSFYLMNLADEAIRAAYNQGAADQPFQPAYLRERTELQSALRAHPPIAEPVANTDRELWRERENDYYANSIHVTESGGVGINVGGRVFVMTLRDWHDLASGAIIPAPPIAAVSEPVAILRRAV